MDIKVKEAQEWLNSTYSGQSWFTSLHTDGITGSTTCKALCKALQYEIGVSGIDGIIGSGTLAVCPTIGPSTTNSNLVKIIQCGFYCKGYECGGITGTYTSATETAATNFRSDIGFTTNDGTMPPRFIKALLNTDAFVLISGGTSYIRNAQQYLNINYITKFSTSWSYIPCNGVPDRNMMKAIIAALQYEEAGQTTSGVDGIYGNNTLAKAPSLSSGTTKVAFVKIVQMCLMCMMETNPGFDGVYNSSLASLISEFQNFYCLSTATSGTVDTVTWASLLSSKGYTSRPALACDTSVILNANKATALYNAGYRYVGRYLSGTVGGTRSKAMTSEEISAIFDAGLNIFAIFQEGTPSLEKYTNSEGLTEGHKAISAALSLGIPENEIIYFAIDYDIMDSNMDKVRSYFKGINTAFNKYGHYYRIGIYGPRNVCTKICNSGLAISSFVSDMSTGFSGNLGYKIPSNWAFDQFYEYTFTGADENFALDKVAYSGRYTGFSYVNDNTQVLPDVSDSYRRNKAVELLNTLGIPLSYDFTYGTKRTYVFPGVEVSVTIYGSADVLPDKNTSISTSVIDGVNTISIDSFLDTAFGSIGSEYTTDIGFKDYTTLFNFSLEIGNGTFGYSYGFDLTGNYIVTLSAEQLLREGTIVNYSAGYEIEYKFLKPDNDPETENVYETFHELVITEEDVQQLVTFIIIVGVIYTAVTSGLGAPALLGCFI